MNTLLIITLYWLFYTPQWSLLDTKQFRKTKHPTKSQQQTTRDKNIYFQFNRSTQKGIFIVALCSWCWLVAVSTGTALFGHGAHHLTDVRRQQVIHFVALCSDKGTRSWILCNVYWGFFGVGLTNIIYVVLTHQRRLTEQFTASHQVADGDMKVGVPAAPVRDFGEGVCH